MAISNYDDLVSEVAEWSHRDDLTNRMSAFVSLTESLIYRHQPATQMQIEKEALTLRSMEVTQTLTPAGNKIAIPDRFLQSRALKVDGREVTSKSLNSLNINPSSGRACAYAITNEIVFDYLPDQDIELTFYQKPEPLTAVNQTNSLLLQFPEIYLYGCLYHAFSYANDKALEVSYYDKFATAINGANQTDDNARFGSSLSITYSGPSL